MIGSSWTCCDFPHYFIFNQKCLWSWIYTKKYHKFPWNVSTSSIENNILDIDNEKPSCSNLSINVNDNHQNPHKSTNETYVCNFPLKPLLRECIVPVTSPLTQSTRNPTVFYRHWQTSIQRVNTQQQTFTFYLFVHFFM